MPELFYTRWTNSLLFLGFVFMCARYCCFHDVCLRSQCIKVTKINKFVWKTKLFGIKALIHGGNDLKTCTAPFSTENMMIIFCPFRFLCERRKNEFTLTEFQMKICVRNVNEWIAMRKFICWWDELLLLDVSASIYVSCHMEMHELTKWISIRESFIAHKMFFFLCSHFLNANISNIFINYGFGIRNQSLHTPTKMNSWSNSIERQNIFYILTSRAITMFFFLPFDVCVLILNSHSHNSNVANLPDEYYMWW